MTETQVAGATKVKTTKDSIIVDLDDGRTITAPLSWYPRLHHGTAKERENWRLIGRGEGIHWPESDEDVSVENLLAAKHSGETPKSFKKWLESRSRE
jgi:hypothetical protein